MYTVENKLFVGKSQGGVSHECIPLRPTFVVVTQEHTGVGCSRWCRLGLQAWAVVHNVAASHGIKNMLFCIVKMTLGCIYCRYVSRYRSSEIQYRMSSNCTVRCYKHMAMYLHRRWVHLKHFYSRKLCFRNIFYEKRVAAMPMLGWARF